MTAAVSRILLPRHQPGSLRPIDELDDGVVALLQLLRELGDRRRPIRSEPPDDEQKLVLRGCQSHPARLLLGEAQECPQRVAEAGQRAVLAVGEVPHGSIVSRSDML